MARVAPTSKPAFLIRAFVTCAATAASSLAVGCAHDTGYGAITTSWDQASTTVPERKTDPESAKGKLTAKELALSFHTSKECATAAKEYYSKEPKQGEALIKACAHRDDFLDLDAVIQGPWSKDLRVNEGLQMVAVEVIARRGGFVEADGKMCRAAGLPIYDVNTALLDKKAVGKIVIVRGTVGGVASEKWGVGKSTVASIRESSWAEDTNLDEGGPIPAREQAEETGRLVFARVESRDDPQLVDRERPRVFALRLEGRRAYDANAKAKKANKAKAKKNAPDDAEINDVVDEDDALGDEIKSVIGTALTSFEASGRIRQ